MERVLLIGYRSGVVKALRRFGVPFALWTQKSVALKTEPLFQLHSDIPAPHKEIEAVLENFRAHGPYTHVLAGTEGAVYAASVARRFFDARKSRHSTVIKCHDKLFMKSHLKRHGVPMTEFMRFKEELPPGQVLDKLGVPVVVKARKLSGSRGITYAETEQAVANSGDRSHILEKFVNAPEASIESFVNGGKILFTNTTQYLKKGHINLVPSQLPTKQVDEILKLNTQVIEALRIQWGITHLEVYLSDSGALFGEIALRPPGGYIMELISKAYGFNAWEAFVSVELDRPFVFHTEARQYTAAHILHPGEGVVRSVNRFEKAVANEFAYKSRLKVKEGDSVAARAGVGEDIGYLLYAAANPETLRGALSGESTLIDVD
ncbi:MAG: ATP-grasp domain-containing protein [Bdellovibrionaceae bacterium]|nr:ATP-grasp domain-containing protein [Pseudobdellovibrionaceae bacterium]